jgi:3-keto-disaccharide hydrolase
MPTARTADSPVRVDYACFPDSRLFLTSVNRYPRIVLENANCYSWEFIMHRRCALTFAVSLLFATFAHAQEKKQDAEWVSLFNGKNLDGWKMKFKGHEVGDNYLDTFRVEDGILKVDYSKYTQFDSKFGHLFFKDKFSHYDLRVEYRFVGAQAKGAPAWALRNNGIMYHCQSPESMRKDQEFPVSIEVQLLGGNGKDARPTGNMCSPGTNIVMNGKLITTHCVNSKSKTFHGDQWVTCEIQVRGAGKVKHLINGEVVMEYEQPQYDPKDKDGAALAKAAGGKLLIEEGYLALQAESHPCEFRKVEIRVVKK